jgi:single-strand DNA-binding protein
MYALNLIVGNLGRDPEMKYTPSGTAVTNFSVATNRQYTNSQGELIKETLWYNIATWGKTAENCNQYLRKGSLVLVEGRLIADPSTGGPKVFTRNADGSAAAKFEISASQVRFLSRREEGETTQQEMAPQDNDDDIPF